MSATNYYYPAESRNTATTASKVSLLITVQAGVGHIERNERLLGKVEARSIGNHMKLMYYEMVRDKTYLFPH